MQEYYSVSYSFLCILYIENKIEPETNSLFVYTNFSYKSDSNSNSDCRANANSIRGKWENDFEMQTDDQRSQLLTDA